MFFIISLSAQKPLKSSHHHSYAIINLRLNCFHCTDYITIASAISSAVSSVMFSISSTVFSTTSIHTGSLSGLYSFYKATAVANTTTESITDMKQKSVEGLQSVQTVHLVQSFYRSLLNCRLRSVGKALEKVFKLGMKATSSLRVIFEPGVLRLVA